MAGSDIESGHEHDQEDYDLQSGCSLAMFTEWMADIEQQPAWRAAADKEMDYDAGNQLNSEVLMRQREIGMPPAIEPLIGPTLDAVLGMEAKSRTDWRVIPDSDKADDDIAEAVNHRLNQAEKQSGADRACSEAYASQIKVGIGWVEVSKNPDPFKYPYRCKAIHRNEIYWDFLSTEPDLSDARYLIRRRWTDRKQAMLLFPQHADLIKHAASGWAHFDFNGPGMDGGQGTGLAMSSNQERGWSIEEQQWRNMYNRRVCIFEVWYREWKRVTVFKMADGRVVEYDPKNPMHVAALGAGVVVPVQAVVPKMRIAWWMGPHKLYDGPTPYRHNKFPYVAFWGKKEDRTGVPYGLIRGMIFLQDEVNARISQMQWGLSSVRTIRTAGAVAGTDEQFRNEIGRRDADIILDQSHMAKTGAKFEVERDATLNQQQFDRLVDAREGIKRTAGVYNAFLGQDGQAKSGIAINGLVEQSTQTLADINDNFKFARSEVGDLMISMLIQDMAGEQQDVVIPGQAIKEDKTIRLNVPTWDEEMGVQYLNNDVERTKLKVTLNDVPSTPTFRTQQLAALSEAFKSMPTQYQSIVLPHLLSLMDVPNKQEILEAVKQANLQPTPEEIEQRIAEAVKQALNDAGLDIKQFDANTKRMAVQQKGRTDNLNAESRWMDAETNAKALDNQEHQHEPEAAAA